MKKVYKPAKFIEVGTTYYIRDKHDPEMYYQVEVIMEMSRKVQSKDPLNKSGGSRPGGFCPFAISNRR